MKKFKETLIIEKSFTELDLMWPHYDDNGERNDVDIPWDEMSWPEVHGMDIDQVIEMMKEIKELGANRIYIGTHEDHHGYYFYGTKLEEL